MKFGEKSPLIARAPRRASREKVYANLNGAPTKRKNADDHEHQPRDASSAAPALGADAGPTPEPDEHVNVKKAYQHQWQQVARQEKRYLEERPIVLRHDPTSRQVLRRWDGHVLKLKRNLHI